MSKSDSIDCKLINKDSDVLQEQLKARYHKEHEVENWNIVSNAIKNQNIFVPLTDKIRATLSFVRAGTTSYLEQYHVYGLDTYMQAVRHEARFKWLPKVRQENETLRVSGLSKIENDALVWIDWNEAKKLCEHVPQVIVSLSASNVFMDEKADLSLKAFVSCAEGKADMNMVPYCRRMLQQVLETCVSVATST